MSLNMTNLYHVFSEHLKAEKPLFLNRDQQCEATYGALDSRSAQYAGALLRAGLEPGDRVAVQIENPMKISTSTAAACVLGSSICH